MESACNSHGFQEYRCSACSKTFRKELDFNPLLHQYFCVELGGMTLATYTEQLENPDFHETYGSCAGTDCRFDCLLCGDETSFTLRLNHVWQADGVCSLCGQLMDDWYNSGSLKADEDGVIRFLQRRGRVCRQL